MNNEKIFEPPPRRSGPGHAGERVKSIVRSAKGGFDAVKGMTFSDKSDRLSLLCEWLYNKNLSVRDYRIARAEEGGSASRITLILSPISIFSKETLACMEELYDGAGSITMVAAQGGIELTLYYSGDQAPE